MIDKKYIKYDTADNEPYVDMEDVYKLFNIKTPYSKWIKRQFKLFELRAYMDYWDKQMESTGGRPKTKYFCLLNQANLIYQREKLNSTIGFNNIKELVFFESLEEILLAADLIYKHMGIIYQYQILKYKVDCCIPDLKLVIEFDEEHHDGKTQKQKDSHRQKKIEQEGFNFIRIKEGSENVGIGNVIKYVIKAWG